MPHIVLTPSFFADASRFRVATHCFEEIQKYVGERYQQGTFFYEHEGYVMRTLTWKKYCLHYQVHQRTDIVEVTGLSDDRPGDGPNKKNFLRKVLERLTAAGLYDEIKDLLENLRDVDFDFLIRHYNWKVLHFLSPTAIAIIEELTIDSAQICQTFHFGVTGLSRQLTTWADEDRKVVTAVHHSIRVVSRLRSPALATTSAGAVTALIAPCKAPSSAHYYRHLIPTDGTRRTDYPVRPFGAYVERSVALVRSVKIRTVYLSLLWYRHALTCLASSQADMLTSTYSRERLIFHPNKRSAWLSEGLAETGSVSESANRFVMLSCFLSENICADGFARRAGLHPQKFASRKRELQEYVTESKQNRSLQVRRACGPGQTFYDVTPVNRATQYPISKNRFSPLAEELAKRVVGSESCSVNLSGLLSPHIGLSGHSIGVVPSGTRRVVARDSRLPELRPGWESARSGWLPRAFLLGHTVFQETGVSIRMTVVNGELRYFLVAGQMQVEADLRDIVRLVSLVKYGSVRTGRGRCKLTGSRKSPRSAVILGREKHLNVHSTNIACRVTKLRRPRIGYGERYGDELNGA